MTNVHINPEGRYILTLEDGTQVDATPAVELERARINEILDLNIVEQELDENTVSRSLRIGATQLKAAIGKPASR